MSTRHKTIRAALGALTLLLASACTQTAPRADVPQWAAAPATAGAPPAALAAGDLRRSGVIDFDVSCPPAVAEDFKTAVALLHSFFYDEARRRFEALATRAPEFAMAWWGVAMTWYHPLWAPPTAPERAQGLAAALRAKELGGHTPIEQGLIEAILAFYTTNDLAGAPVVAGCNCCGPQAHGVRARAFNEHLEKLHRRFPAHVETTIFYALSMLGTVDPKDKTFARQRAAAALLEPLFALNSDHPGIAHYIIHAYDYPELAERALPAARRYDDIAPWVPHALHMPTHIYTRLGMWKDSIEGNVASSLAARDHAARHYDGGTVMDDLHAMDYLVFAFLQTGQDTRAGQLLDDLRRIRRIVPGNGFASAYAAAAIPARFALERGDFVAASELTLPLPEFVGAFPMAAAHIEFARAVGGARSGRLAVAEASVQKLRVLRDALPGTRLDLWTAQVDIQLLAATAWLEDARGNGTAAAELLEKASGLEDAAGTHPVTPGQILPAREQLGELLLAQGDAEAALAQFERSLQAFPRRFRSHNGALAAAQAIGDQAAALRHAKSLIEMAGASRERASTLSAARALIGE